MSVYLLLPTRNNLEWLKESYKSLRDWTNLKDYKLKVFDSACTDGTQEFLYENHIDFFSSMTNVSGEKSSNYLISEALKDKKMTHVCFIHDDMIFTKSWLDDMLCEIQKNEDCYCMGCLSVIHKKAFMIPDDRRNLVADQLREEYTGRAGAPMFLIKRECLEKIGLFDDKFEFGECSDNDYYKRIEDAGKQFLLTHKAVVFHGEKIARSKDPFQEKNIELTKKYFSKKWEGADLLKWGDKVIRYARADGEDWKLWGAR